MQYIISGEYEDVQKAKTEAIENLKGSLDILVEYVDEIVRYINLDETPEDEQRKLLKDLVRVTDKIDAAIDPLDVWINGDNTDDLDPPVDH